MTLLSRHGSETARDDGRLPCERHEGHSSHCINEWNSRLETAGILLNLSCDEEVTETLQALWYSTKCAYNRFQVFTLRAELYTCVLHAC